MCQATSHIQELIFDILVSDTNLTNVEVGQVRPNQNIARIPALATFIFKLTTQVEVKCDILSSKLCWLHKLKINTDKRLKTTTRTSAEETVIVLYLFLSKYPEQLAHIFPIVGNQTGQGMQESRSRGKEASLQNVDMFCRVQCLTQYVGFIILFIHISLECTNVNCKLQFACI